ncbi:MAG TPA: thioredoxin domain-containing protein [bacterium]|nr:thioredoxin domain-containing protein [bacterium]
MTDAAAQHSNRLINEASPYLLQHAHNPVDWYPWGPEAIALARQRDVPIFLSIGYSTCHWCHVMERECFEDEAVARAMNEMYVNIKVDREEYPDLDGIYMRASQALTGYGGWPLNVWLTPDLVPYYSGGYMPATSGRGHPGFIKVLEILAEQYHLQRDKVDEIAAQVKAALAEHQGAPSAQPLEERMILNLVNAARQSFDPLFGGFGRAPKFPPAMLIVALLRYAQRSGDTAVLPMVTKTLDAMAQGGIYDHIGGGFARYSTDARWLVPHFEKMLYDNALLVEAYTEAYQLTKNPDYARVVRETCDYVLRDMTHPDGGFYSAEDADSLPSGAPEGTHKEEGAFYLFTPEELEEALGDRDLAGVIGQYYGATKGGNFEGRTILNVTQPPAQFVKNQGIDREAFDTQLAMARAKLLDYRARRPRPHLDDKILTSWNGLMIGALAKAGIALPEPRYIDAARRAAAFVESHLRDPESGALLRRWRAGDARLEGTVEDYAFYANGLLDLYNATLEAGYFVRALALAQQMVAKFEDPVNGGFFLTAADTPDLLMRPKEGFDNATPSGNSAAAYLCARLAHYTGDQKWREHAERAIGAFGELARQAPSAFAYLLRAAQFLLADPVEVVIAGDLAKQETKDLIAAVYEDYRPFAVLLHADPSIAAVAAPLIEGRVASDGKAMAYVCRNFACRQPVADPEGLRLGLAGNP